MQDARVVTGIYLHIPFCRIKCPYCDFNSYAGIEDQIPRYVSALKTELTRRLEAAAQSPYRPSTVYFGGGSPSVLPPNEIAALLAIVQEIGRPEGPMEVTLEANPGTVDRDRLRAFKEAGVNRLTVGAQTFRRNLLPTLGRLHDVDETRQALADARAVGFPQLNLDLMFGLSGQRLEDWEEDLRDGLAEGPTHISLYNLTVEEGTPYARWQQEGKLVLPDEELAARMYELAVERTAAAGLARYEVSNFARPSSECLHNRLYWEGSPWLGVGAGAHGFAPEVGDWGRRWWNLRVPREYCERVEAGELPEADDERLTEDQARDEALLLELRTREGLDRERFARRFGADIAELAPRSTRGCVERGELHLSAAAVTVSPAGVLVLDSIVQALSAEAGDRRGRALRGARA